MSDAVKMKYFRVLAAFDGHSVGEIIQLPAEPKLRKHPLGAVTRLYDYTPPEKAAAPMAKKPIETAAVDPVVETATTTRRGRKTGG